MSRTLAPARGDLPSQGDYNPILIGREERLFFRLASPHVSLPADEPLTSDNFDWDKFVELVLQQGVVGAVWRALQMRGAPVPPAAAARMQGFAALSDFRLLAVHRLLERTVACFAEREIDVVLLKGAALGAFIYRDLGDRNMGDLDLLVPPGRAEESVMAARQEAWSTGLAEPKLVLYDKHHHLPPLVDTLDLDIRLELHTDVLPNGHPFRFGAETLRARATQRSLGGYPVFVPSIEDLLVYSCVHLAWSHEMRIGGWRTFRDVSELVVHRDFSWARFGQIAGDSTLAPACYWTLRLASRLCGTPIPADILAALRPPMSDWVEEVVTRHNVLQVVPLARGVPSEALGRLLWSAGMRPRRAGHGSVRPWQFGDRWLETSRALRPSAPHVAHWWMEWGRIRELTGYLRLLTPS